MTVFAKLRKWTGFSSPIVPAVPKSTKTNSKNSGKKTNNPWSSWDVTITEKNKIVHPLKHSNDLPVIIYYATETFTSKMEANTFQNDLVIAGMKDVETKNLGEIEINQHTLCKEHIALFMISTTGNGEPPTDVRNFFKWIMESHSFENLYYSVLSFGDSKYQSHVYPGKFMDNILTKHGGKRIHEMIIADSSGRESVSINAWKRGIKGVLISTPKVQKEDSDKPILRFDISKTELTTTQSIRLSVSKKKDVHLLPVTSIRNLVKNGDRNPILHLELDTKNHFDLEYVPGGTLEMYPFNSKENVEFISTRMGYSLHEMFNFVVPKDCDMVNHHLDPPFHTPCTIDQALTYHCDFNAPPTQTALQQMAFFALDKIEKDKLKELSDESKYENYEDYILKNYRSTLSILKEFLSVKMPLAYLLQMVPRVVPRKYTISSSQHRNPYQIHLTISICEHELSNNSKFYGLCSNMLLNMLNNQSEEENKVIILTSKATVEMPENSCTPIIMVGVGSGIAPFRAFLQERQYLQDNGKPIGEAILYFGCRHRMVDFIYEDELDYYMERGVLSRLHLAFSRDQEEKNYVQHVMKKQAESLWDLLNNKNACLYVCGKISMKDEFMETLIYIVTTQGGMDEVQGKEYVQNLSNTSRLFMELW